MPQTFREFVSRASAFNEKHGDAARALINRDGGKQNPSPGAEITMMYHCPSGGKFIQLNYEHFRELHGLIPGLPGTITCAVVRIDGFFSSFEDAHAFASGSDETDGYVYTNVSQNRFFTGKIIGVNRVYEVENEVFVGKFTPITLTS